MHNIRAIKSREMLLLYKFIPYKSLKGNLNIYTNIIVERTIVKSLCFEV